jgi:hypothetical protein
MAMNKVNCKAEILFQQHCKAVANNAMAAKGEQRVERHHVTFNDVTLVPPVLRERQDSCQHDQRDKVDAQHPYLSKSSNQPPANIPITPPANELAA